MEELIYLLENYWILKEKDRNLYYRIRDSINTFKEFVVETLGYNIIVTSEFIKLEKYPGEAEEWMGITEFENISDYQIFLLLLIFLEDKGKEEQFILSQVTEFITDNYYGEQKIDWTMYATRKSLIRVFKYCMKLMLIKVNYGDEDKFASNVDEEVLYESTGLSRYVVRVFRKSIYNYKNYKEIENDTSISIIGDRGITLKQRAFRKLILSPVVYNNDIDAVRYIKNQKNFVGVELNKYFGGKLHAHKNGVLMLVNDGSIFEEVFPTDSTLSDIILQVNAAIVDKVMNREFMLSYDDTIHTNIVDFRAMVYILRKVYSSGWSKEYRTCTDSRLIDDILKYMKSFNMLRIENDYDIKILPLVGKVIGRYPKDFEKVLGFGDDYIDA